MSKQPRLKCKAYKDYTAQTPPTCGCIACNTLWKLAQAIKADDKKAA